MADTEWFEDYVKEEEESEIDEYELIATPNDFNVTTIYNFLESGAVKIPGFQRNYVWDIKRASKLIESLILGLPVPQIFLYEEARNKFLVIDGQQRLMSIYYFIKQRFPRQEKRIELRRIFDREGTIPDRILHNDDYFRPFKLSLTERLPDRKNKFKDLNYGTLDDYKSQLDLRPVRNVIVKQAKPPGDDSSVFEIFNRLNTGGINLRPQEIRVSLFHSPFYEMLHRINLDPQWRRLLQMPDPDLHMKDVEVLLRGFAMLMEGDKYRPSMSKFLNSYSRRSQGYPPEMNKYLEQLFTSFLSACSALSADAFVSARTRRFSIALYEAVFSVVCAGPLHVKGLVDRPLDESAMRTLDTDSDFVEASEKASADKANVDRRLRRAREFIPHAT